MCVAQALTQFLIHFSWNVLKWYTSMKYANYFKGGGLFMTDEEKVLLDFLKVNSAYEAKVIPGTSTFTFMTKLTGIPQVWKLDEEGEAVSVH